MTPNVRRRRRRLLDQRKGIRADRVRRQLTFGAALAAITFGAALAAIVTALVVPGRAPAATRNSTLIGTDGPGFTITMSKTTVKAGTYTIVVNDKSNIHNFHLIGPGVNKLTSVALVGTKTWTVELKKGAYRFVCDPHAAIMKGVLRVT